MDLLIDVRTCLSRQPPISKYVHWFSLPVLSNCSLGFFQGRARPAKDMNALCKKKISGTATHFLRIELVLIKLSSKDRTV